MAEERSTLSVSGRAGLQMPGVKSRRREDMSQKALGLGRKSQEGPEVWQGWGQMMELYMQGPCRKRVTPWTV